MDQHFWIDRLGLASDKPFRNCSSNRQNTLKSTFRGGGFHGRRHKQGPYLFRVVHAIWRLWTSTNGFIRWCLFQCWFGTNSESLCCCQAAGAYVCVLWPRGSGPFSLWRSWRLSVCTVEWSVTLAESQRDYTGIRGSARDSTSECSVPPSRASSPRWRKHSDYKKCRVSKVCTVCSLWAIFRAPNFTEEAKAVLCVNNMLDIKNGTWGLANSVHPFYLLGFSGKYLLWTQTCAVLLVC